MLWVSVDVLPGLAGTRGPRKMATNRVERQMLKIEKLDPKAKRQIAQLRDSFIEGEKLERRMNACTGSRPNTQSTQEA